MCPKVSRRQFLNSTAAGVASAGALLSPGRTYSAESDHNPLPSGTITPVESIRYCLNTSTIREQKLGLQAEVDLCIELGYDGIEPWVREIQAYREAGHSLNDLRKRIADGGLTVDSAIGFARWIVDDPAERAKGLETMKRDMELVRRIGGTRIAAPPVGATDQTDLNLFAAAERYAKVLAIGREIGVTPQVEVWGFSKSLSRLGEVMFVASEAGATDACLLPDVYHLFKGGSDFRGLATVHGGVIQVMHLNDYPGGIPRDKMADKHRVYPGDGIAPLANIIHLLRSNGFAGTFSLELFNPTYWQQPAKEVAKTGLTKMRAAVKSSEHPPAWPL